jgi:peptide/nickel transport system substrate-binding protein
MAYASRSAELLAAMFAEVGVDAKIVPTEFPAKWIEEVFRAKDFDMTIVAHAEPLDIEIYGRETYYFNYKSQPFRDLMADIARTTDDKARMAKYAEAQKMLAQDLPALFLFQLPKLGVWNAKLKGMWENTPIPSNDVTEVYWAD